MYHFLLFVLINTVESLITNLFIIKMNNTEAEFLDKIQTKVLRVFLLSQSSVQLCLEFTQPLMYFYISVTLHYEGESRKT
jgi:hypothetical protein